MVGRGTGGGGGGGRGVDLAGYASQAWVEQQYISKEFFLRLFSIHGHNAEDASVNPEDIIIEPNDTDEDTTVLDSIEAKAGLWTNSFVSALGLNPAGGGTGDILSEPLLSINSAGLGLPTRPNVGIVWDGTRWVYGETGGGSTGMNPLTVKVGTNTTVIEYKGETAKTLTFDAVANSGITVSGDTGGTIKIGYTLPTASANTLGGVKVGNTLSISDGVLNLPAISNLVAGTYRSVTVDAYGRVTAGTNPTTLAGYGITDAKIANGVITLGTNTITPLTDAKIKSDYEWWGQKMNADGKVNGNITIQLTTVDTNTYADANPKLIFKNANDSQNISLTFTDYDAVAYPASLTLNGNQGNELFIAPRMKADRLYLYKPNGSGDTNAVYLEYDSANSGVHLVGAGFYSDSFISALGLNDSGGSGGVTLNEPLSSINSSLLGSPSGHTNSTLVYNGSSWVWSNTQGVSLGAYNFSAFAGNFNTLAINNKAVATQEWVDNQGFVKLVTGKNQSYIDGTLGSYVFEGSKGTWTGLDMTDNDWAGLQVGGNNDRWQLMAKSQTLFFRQNDNDADHFSANNWGDWKEILTTANTKISGQTITINGTSLTVPTGGGSISGTQNRLAYFSNASTLGSTGNIAYLPNTADSTANKGLQNGIRIWGATYGNSASDLVSGAIGDIRYGDGGPQIQFSTGASREQDGALIFTDHDQNSKFLGSSFHFVSTEGTNGANTWVVSPRFHARKTLSIGDTSSTSYSLYVGGTAHVTDKLSVAGTCNLVGNVGVGTSASSTYRLYVSGSVYSSGGYYHSSYDNNYVLMAGGGAYQLKNLTVVNDSGWVGQSNDSKLIPTMAMIAFWNGRYSSSASNLQYCKDGEILSKAGGTCTGDYIIEKAAAAVHAKGKNSQICTMLADGTKKVGLNSDSNYGVYSWANGGWLIGCNGTNTFIEVGNVGIGTTNPTAKLEVNGSVKIGGATLTWDSDKQALKIDKGFYSDSFVSALGANASGGSGGGTTLTEPLLSINTSTLGNPSSHPNQTFVYNGGKWIWSNELGATITAYNMSAYSITSTYISGTNIVDSGKLTVGQSSLNTSYQLYVNGSSLFNGNVGIGGYNGNYKLYVSGDAYVSNSIYLDITENRNVYIRQYSPPSSGVSLCNIVAPSGLSVNGTTSWSSDMRKKDVVSYVNDLDVNKVAKAPVFRFTWKDKRDSVVRVGTSAQYWQGALASSVMDMGEYGLMLDYNAITIASAVITARKVVDHELRVKQLEERIAELENEIDELKAA